jgi:hypothetical protein
MKQYIVNYGAVPYQQRAFRNYSDASAFIKKQLDLGIAVRSVSKEECETGHQVVGIISKEDYIKRTIAIAKGEHKPKRGEPKIWFDSLEEANPEQLAWHAACLEEDVEALEAEVERLRNAVAEEREACALVCEAIPATCTWMDYDEDCMECARAIRARGEK